MNHSSLHPKYITQNWNCLTWQTTVVAWFQYWQVSSIQDRNTASWLVLIISTQLGSATKHKILGNTNWALIMLITDTMDTSLSKLQETVKDREAWHAVLHGVTKSRTRLSDWTTTTLLRASYVFFQVTLPTVLELHNTLKLSLKMEGLRLQRSWEACLKSHSKEVVAMGIKLKLCNPNACKLKHSLFHSACLCLTGLEQRDGRVLNQLRLREGKLNQQPNCAPGKATTNPE